MRRSSIKFKFLLKITGTLVVVFTLGMGLAFGLFWSEVKEAVRDRGDALSFALRERARNTLDMSGGDPSALEAHSIDLQSLVGGRNRIEYARIVKRDGRVIASHTLNEIGKQVEAPPEGTLNESVLVTRPGLMDTYIPITSELFVQLGFDNARFTQKATRTALLIFLVALGAMALIYLLVGHWVQQTIEGPLENLGRDAARMADGDLTVDFSTDDGGVDELNRLNHAFTGMSAGIRNIVSQINAVSKNISGQVSELQQESVSITSAVTQQTSTLKTSIQSVESIDRNTGEINGRIEELFLVSQETSSSILQIGGSIEEVEQHVSKLSLAVGETSSSITEIGRSISEVAGRSQELAQNADEMTRAISDITATISEVEKSVQQSTDLSREVTLTAREGLESVEKSGAGMERIKAIVTETNEVMQALGKRSEQINEIVTVINQVTEKTNLLALNAAIIAAAAGEHGASFAVVADGIRDLARQVAAKTREIEGLIQGVQKETRKAKEKVDAGLVSVVEGEQLSSAAQEKLRQIYETSTRSEDMSRMISSAMVEQTKNSRALAEASSRVSTISHQIALATQQEASASSQIQRSIAQMEDLAKSVLRTTHEQSEGSRRISEATTKITSAIQAISEITSHHKAESEAVLYSIHENQSLLNENERSVQQLRQHIGSINAAVKELQDTVAQFKLG
jgi:methyl-accepting chemotaxis protein